MGQWKFHTPNGVIDLLPETCRSKRLFEQQLRRVFEQRGYMEIETPTIEFYDVYAAGSGSVLQEDLFKFFDEQGRILCLRYDGTVPAARLAATVCRDLAPPIRFSYIGNMFRYKEFGGGRQREFSQAGVELMGNQSPQADAEVIATAIASARACGIEDLHVSIGQVAFFKALLQQWRITGEDAEILPRLINSKEMVALEEFYARLSLPDMARQILTKLATGYEQDDMLNELNQLVDYPGAQTALRNLQDVLAILDDYGVMKYVTVDLGMLQSLNYYSGIIFKGFTYGIGFPLFSGGRYDQLVAAFGRDLSATGFSIGVNFIHTALSRQGKLNLAEHELIRLGYESSSQKKAFYEAEVLRKQGHRVICDMVQTDSPDQFFASRKAEPSERTAFISGNGALIWKGE